MQFPLKHIDAEPPLVDKARFKPKHRRLELQVPYPDHCINEDSDTHQSVLSHSVALKTNMGVGMIKDGAMYINSIKEVLQCRPSFKNLQPISHVNDSDVDDDDDDGDMDGVKEKEEEEDVEKDDQEILQQVALKRKESGKAQALRLQSYSHVHAQEEAEEWQELNVYPLGTLNPDDAFHAFYNDNSKSTNEETMASAIKIEVNTEST